MPSFTEEQLRVVFDLFDCDGSGFVGVTEMPLALKALGLALTQADVDKAVADATDDGITRVTFDHFKSIALPQAVARNSDAEIRFTFALLDRKGRGAIDVEDLVAATQDMSSIGSAGEKPHRKLFAEFVRECNAAFPAPPAADGGAASAAAGSCGSVDEQQFAASVRLAVHSKPRVN